MILGLVQRQELALMILVGPFQLRICYNSVIFNMSVLELDSISHEKTVFCCPSYISKFSQTTEFLWFNMFLGTLRECAGDTQRVTEWSV